jgi:hypothetical protein
MSFIKKLKIIKNIKICDNCKGIVIPLLGFWFHEDNDCTKQDGLMVYEEENRVIVEVLNNDLQKAFKKEYGEADIVNVK